MRKYLPIIGLIGLFALNANSAEPQTETCEQIRVQIKAQTGVLTRPDTVLLGKVGARPECRFSAVEAYRAAWGDKPMPKDQPRNRRHDNKQREDND